MWLTASLNKSSTNGWQVCVLFSLFSFVFRFLFLFFSAASWKCVTSILYPKKIQHTNKHKILLNKTDCSPPNSSLSPAQQPRRCLWLYKMLNCAKLNVIATKKFCTLRHLNKFTYALSTGQNALLTLHSTKLNGHHKRPNWYLCPSYYLLTTYIHLIVILIFIVILFTLCVYSFSRFTSGLVWLLPLM